MHTAQDKFVCHVFLCEPSSGALCKTIEAACKVSTWSHYVHIFCHTHSDDFVSLFFEQLRYQKCLDAHPESRLSTDSNTPNKGLGATIKNLMNTLSLNKKDRACSWERAKSLQVANFANTFLSIRTKFSYWTSIGFHLFFANKPNLRQTEQKIKHFTHSLHFVLEQGRMKNQNQIIIPQFRPKKISQNKSHIHTHFAS